MLPVSEATTETSGGTGTGTGTETAASPATKTDAKAKKGVKPEVKADPELGTLLTNYADAADKAQSFYVDMIQYIKRENISKAVLVKTLMEYRKVEASTAVTQASRIMTMAKNDEVVNALAAGEITLKVAREQTKASRTSAASTSGGTNEAKEATYEKTLKAFAAAAKACGYDLKSIIAGVKATLQAEPFNIK